jgi:hypothetical protein
MSDRSKMRFTLAAALTAGVVLSTVSIVASMHSNWQNRYPGSVAIDASVLRDNN